MLRCIGDLTEINSEVLFFCCAGLQNLHCCNNGDIHVPRSNCYARRLSLLHVIVASANDVILMFREHCGVKLAPTALTNAYKIELLW